MVGWLVLEFSAYFIRPTFIYLCVLCFVFFPIALPVDILEVVRNFGPILSDLFGLIKLNPFTLCLQKVLFSFNHCNTLDLFFDCRYCV